MMPHLIIKIKGVKSTLPCRAGKYLQNGDALQTAKGKIVDIDCFDGNLLNYTYFRDIFKKVVERKI